jgi:hypothetical protein
MKSYFNKIGVAGKRETDDLIYVQFDDDYFYILPSCLLKINKNILTIL